MMLICRVFTLGLILSFTAPALAITEQANQTATEFYQAYRKAFAKAQKIEEILPMMAASQRAKMEKTPADERSMMFDMLKEMTAAQGDVKVLKETATKSGAELTLETKGETGTATLIKEGGAWKLEKESWRGK